jgi:hypothetical protein
MKLLTFRHNGKETYGVVSGTGVVDLGKRLGATYPDLKTLIAKGGLEEAKKAASASTTRRTARKPAVNPPTIRPYSSAGPTARPATSSRW